MTQTDIILIGAGACGLIAARELSKRGKNIIVVEAQKRCGGRIHTISSHGFSRPVEEGGEFVHGNLPLTKKLAREAKLELITISGDMFQKTSGTLKKQEEFVNNGDLIAEKLKELDGDMSVRAFLDKYFSAPEYATLKNETIRYIEGYDAADIDKASAQAMAADVADEEDQYRIKGGYDRLINFLEEECVKSGVQFFFEQVVKEVFWSAGEVQVRTKDGVTYVAPKVVVTVPLGILQSESEEATIQFIPAIPDCFKAANAIGYGTVIKFMFEFHEPFWETMILDKDLSNMGFIFSNERVPTWWTQKPENTALLTGWLAGPNAEKLREATTEQLLTLGIDTLASIFEMQADALRELLRAWHIKNWKNEPYSLGAYSYATLGGKEAKELLATPVEDTIYFAGEGVYNGEHIATVEAALTDGVRVAKEIG